MPAKEIKELRIAGKLNEALELASTELSADPEGIWPKRNIAWVYYELLKQNASPEHFKAFIEWIHKIKSLELPAGEIMLMESMCWQIGKMLFNLIKSNSNNHHEAIQLFEEIKSFEFPKPSDGYSYLFKAFHKSLKTTDRYLEFADWWDFANFQPAAYEKEKLANGKEVMSIAEQAYISYAKNVLPKFSPGGEKIFNQEKALEYLPTLSKIVEDFPQFQYPAYFLAKLLLALDEKENIMESFLPFAKKKRNDFWVWELMAELYSNDSEKVFACYCKALTCKSPEEMLVGLRQKMAGIFISKKLFNEAKTEIELLVKARNEHSYKIPGEVLNWISTDWFKQAQNLSSNHSFYKKYSPLAEALLFSDIPEELVIVEFVNSDKKMLNFIASEEKFGFFKYERFLNNVKIGDVLKVRFQGGSSGSIHQVCTAMKVNDPEFKNQFLKSISGTIKIPSGKSFGFLEDAFIHPSFISKLKLSDGMHYSGYAIKSYNTDRKQFTWKFIGL